MTTLPDYWFVYITINDDLDRSELTAITPAAMNRREMSINGRKVLAAVEMFCETNDHGRVVFLADVTAWLHYDKGFEWHDLDVDLDEAIATLHESGPSIVLHADPTALAVAACGRANMVLLAPGQPEERAGDFDAEVRADIVDVLTANWHVVAPGVG
ncbi:MAG: hypothetical protein R8G01_01540 [Ilumatobacteraceae bacterium]|nr:hypothetical protein [Ilumatobacteraceae bacterium]